MTFDDAYDVLLDVISRCGARPGYEAEDFLTKFVANFSDMETLRASLEENAPKWFRCLGALPEWIQEADWPWFDGKPMVFVGSIDAPSGTFHDDGRFFLFWSPKTGITDCVIQVA